MTVLAIKPRNEELNIFLGPNDVWTATSRTLDGTSLVACGESPEDALAQLRHGVGDNLAPYTIGDLLEAIEIALSERDALPPYPMFAVLLERELGGIPNDKRPFGHWERWLTLARHALDVVRPTRRVTPGVASLASGR